MTLFFFPVNNELDLGRHSFDNVDFFNEEELKKFLDTISKLDGVHSYDMSKNTYQSSFPCLCDFVEDFNDEELDNGYWCVAVPITEDDYINYLKGIEVDE